MKLSALLHPNRIPCGLAVRTKDEAPLERAAKLSQSDARGARALRVRRLVGSGTGGEILQRTSGSR